MAGGVVNQRGGKGIQASSRFGGGAVKGLNQMPNACGFELQ
jgi:hypothetical protein